MSSPYLAPIERPRGLVMKLIYFFMRRQFGKAAARTFMVFPPRMPFAFTRFYMKSYALDKKLTLSRELQALIREQVASTNGCLFCMDASRYYALTSQVTDAARFDALPEYRSSALFNEPERAALDYATELTKEKHVAPETFDRLARFYSEREICDIVWLVASEHLSNMTNMGLNVGSAGLCERLPRAQVRGKVTA